MKRSVVVLAVAALVLSACGSARDQLRAARAEAPTSRGDVSGRIRIDGSSTVFPVSQLAAELFHERQPGVDIAVGFSGTGGGFKKFCAGEIDIADASRSITAEEREACADAGITFREFKVALDGITNAVPNDNTWADCLTMEQLAKIWAAGSDVDSWDDVDPAYPRRRLELFGPGPDSGTFDFFVEEVLGEDAQPRQDYTASEDDNVLVQGIAGSPNALGYFGYAYYGENEGKLKAVAVDGGSGCVEPTADTIEAGTYALSRPLFIYVRDDALEGSEAVRAFVEFYLDQAVEIAPQVGYVAPTQKTLEADRDELRAATG